ncbi:MAG: hypothetical protein MI861_22050, partial [Pirellulales bacterium]|nr:hypothetical protein [Pirellulales bacterium]
MGRFEFDGSAKVVEKDAAPAKPKRSWSLAGSVGVNVIRGRARAVISDTDVTFKSLDVLASDDSRSILISGALAISTGSPDAKGISGSIVTNIINNDTDARIERSTVVITGGDLVVEAINDSDVITISMGASGAGKAGIAGSVAINSVGSEARAKIVDNSTVTVTADPTVATSGDVKVNAKDATTIVSIAGAGGFAAGKIARERYGVGAAVNFVVVTQREGTLAIVEDSDVTADDEVKITATNDNLVTGVTIAIAGAFGGVSTNSLAAAVSIGVVIMDTNTRASARRKKSTGIRGKKGVNIEALDDSHFVTIAGGAALSGSAGGFSGSGRAGGGSATIHYFNQDAHADITEMPVTSTEGSVVVKAESQPTMTTIAAGAAVGGDSAFQGSFAISVLQTNTSAKITGAASKILTDGNVAVIAEDEAKLVGVAGSVALGAVFSSSKDPISSFGLANATMVKLSTVDAFIDDDITVQANGDRGTTKVPTSKVSNKKFQTADRRGVAVAAVSNATITNVAAGGAISGSNAGGSFAGSATVTVINDKTRARIGDRTKINTDPTEVASGANEHLGQSVTVVAADRTKLDGIAGAAGISFGSGGVGAGVDVAVVTKNTDARIEANADVEAQSDVIVDAFSQENILSVSASIGVGKSFGVAFGVGVSIYDVTTVADVGASTQIEALGSVVVGADDKFVHELGTGSAGIGGKKVGGAGSFGVPRVKKTTKATINSNAKVDAHALRSGLKVANGDFTAFGDPTLQDGELGTADLDHTHLPTGGDKSYFRDRKAKPVTINDFKGVSVTAISKTAMEVYAVGAGIAGKIGIAGSLIAAKTDETTQAKIGSAAEINQKTSTPGNNQSVNVAAGNDLFMRVVSGALGIAGQVAASGGVNLIKVDMDTKAEIANSAKLGAAKDIKVRAYAEEDIIDVGVSVAGTGGAFALSGSVAVLDLNNTTKALVGDQATITAGGNVVVYAEDRTDADIIAGGVGLAFGGGGIGGSVGVSLLSKDTEATIGASTVDALGKSGTFSIFNGKEQSGNAATESIRGVGVSSHSSEDVFVLSVAGSVGFSVGIAGAVNWQKIDSDTTAQIKSGAKINQAANNAAAAHADQDVYVVALNRLTSTGIAGALGFSAGFGAGGGVDVGTVDSSTIAKLGGDVTARRDVRVASTADRFVRSIAAAGSVALVGVAGGVSRWTIGGDVGSNYSVAGETANPLGGYDNNGATGETVNSDTESQLDNSLKSDSGYSSNESKNRGDNSRMAGHGMDRAFGNFGSFVGKLTTIHVSETRALILPSATVTAGDDVEVEARDKNDIRLSGGGATISTVGIGAGIALLDIATPVEASIGQNATVSATDKVEVRATSDESLRAISIAGTGALLGGAASYARIVNNGNKNASLLSGVSILDASSLDVVANHRADLLATSGSGAIGAIVAGISGASVTAGAKVQAYTQDVAIGTAANRVGNINISATSDIDNNRNQGRMAHAVGVSGGAVSATAVDAKTTVHPEVVASIGANSQVYSNGSVSVVGLADNETNAVATGIDVGAVALGATFATATLDPDVKAVVGDFTTIEGASIDVKALHNVSKQGAVLDRQARAKSHSGKGGIVTASGATSTAEAKGSAATTLGASVILESTTTDVVITAQTSNDANGDSDGKSIAFLGFGKVNGKAVIDSSSQVTVGRDALIRSKNDVKIAAKSRDDADARGNAGGWAAIPISHAVGIMDVTNDTDVFVANGANLSAANTLSVLAEVDHRTKSEGRFFVPAVALGADGKTEATTTITTDVDLDFVNANLQGRDVDLISRVKQLNATAKTYSKSPVGFRDDTDATSRLTSTTHTDVELFRTTVVGQSTIDILSEHPSINTLSDAFADSTSIRGDTVADAQNTTTIDSDISADAGSALTTKALVVRSSVPAQHSIREKSDRSKAASDRGFESPEIPTANITRDIVFNAKVNVADTGPALVIDANGNVTKQTGGVTFTDDGTTITVNSIINSGNLLGSVSFEIPNNVGTRTLSGSATVERQQSYLGVEITNESARDLKLNQIRVSNPNGRVQVDKTAGVTDTLTIAQPPAAPGSTTVNVQNTQGITLNSGIDNPYGSTTITANAGDIVRNFDYADILTAVLKLEAKSGNIGKSAATALERFESKSRTSATATDL